MYKNYGGRPGNPIKLSEEFRNPLVFIDYMRSVGDVRDAFIRKLEIDRVDNDRGYERGNLRWATRLQQAYNRRNTKRVTYNGETLLFKDFVAKYCSIGFSRARNLLDGGATLEEIVARVGRGPRGPYKKTRTRIRSDRGGTPA